MSGAATAHRQGMNDEGIDFEETDESSTVNGLIYDKVYEAAEKFAGTHVGQFATGKVDRILKLVEDTAKWSLPQSNEDKNDSIPPLERPLPWIPFIAMILMLRMVRLSLSLGGLFIGNAPLVPGDVVYFIQTRRRKLRSIRVAGMRDIRRKEQAKRQKQNDGIVSKLRSLLSVVVCRPGQGRETPKSSPINNQRSLEGTSRTGSNATNTKQDNPSSKRQRVEDDGGSDNDLTLDQIIDKYGGASSDNDSDFIPPDNALNDEDTSSESTSSATSDDGEEDADETEDVKDVKQPTEDANPESDAHMTNGNRRFQESSHIPENQDDDKVMVIKENGEHFSKPSRRPVPVPKPHRQEPLPKPIQEIKQEPADSDEDRSDSQQLQQDSTELKRSSEEMHNQQQQSVVARSDEKDNVYEGPEDEGIADGDVETADKKVNGGENVQEIDHKSGSPNLSGNFGFQPTSILKNPNAVHLEKRGPAIPYTDDDKLSKEITAETHAASRPINTSHQPARSSIHAAKHNKNKFRGKRR